jgi:hypothetical protein
MCWAACCTAWSAAPADRAAGRAVLTSPDQTRPQADSRARADPAPTNIAKLTRFLTAANTPGPRDKTNRCFVPDMLRGTHEDFASLSRLENHAPFGTCGGEASIATCRTGRRAERGRWGTGRPVSAEPVILVARVGRAVLPQTRHPPAAHNVVTRPAYVAMFGAPTRSARHLQPAAAISRIWSARVLSRN